ncbi:MAG: hypothetical protein IGR76_02685 [Synechococcales cyanobacterium T60_A2020_003]|nr:hypothetical protein [Synechococcales cyanobacterium T60_A2020_003]
MTQPKLMELAKQGEPQAIAILMNRSLQPQGMSVKVSREGDRLSVLLQADQTPNRLVMTNFVRNGITNLKLQSVIQTVEIIGQRTGDDQPAWTQELDLAAMDSANGLLDALDTPPSATEATGVESSLDLEPSSTEPVESLGDWEETPAANDFTFEDAGLLDDDALVFEEEPLTLDASPAPDMGLDFSALDEGDMGVEASSSPDLFGLDGDASEPSTFDLDRESSEFNALDLESSSVSAPADESLSLFADTPDDFNLESLDAPSGLNTDDMFSSSPSGDLDLSFDASDASLGEPASDLFGLDLPGEDSSDQSFDTWDTPAASLEESSDDWDAPAASFEESPDLFVEESNDLGFSGFDSVPSDDFPLESEESSFAVSASDTPEAPFIDSELAVALTEDAYPDEFDSFESNDFGLETMEPESGSTDSDLGNLFGSSSLDDLGMASEIEAGALDWDAEPESAFDQPESASSESAFGLEELPFTNTEDFSFSTEMGLGENAESSSSISEEVATLFGQGDMDLNAFESFSSTPDAFMGAEYDADEMAEMSPSDDLEMDRFASESDSSNLFGDNISTDDTLSADVDNLFSESGFGRSSEIDNDSPNLEDTDFDLSISSFDESDRSDESLLFDADLPNLEATDELTGVETLSDEDSGFETATSKDNPVPADLDFGMEASDASSEDSEDWDSFNALDSSDLSTTGSDAWNVDASLDENAAFEGSESERAELSNLDLNLSASDISDPSDWSLESETFVNEAGVEETPSIPDSDLDFDAAPLDLDLALEGSLFVDTDTESSFENNGMALESEPEGLGLSEFLPEGALLGTAAFLGANAFAHHGDDESLESGDRAEAESFADIPDADLDLAMDLDDIALNDFADSSEDLDAEAARFELTSGDLDDGVASAAGFVIDAETALPPEFTETSSFESDLSPMGLDLDSDFTAAIAPDEDLTMGVSASPIADLTPLAEGQEDVESWVSTQNTLIDEDDVLFEIDEEALDNSAFTPHPELDDEIVLTPDIHEGESNGWNEAEFGEVEVNTPPLTPEEAAAMAIASENQKESATVPVPPSDSTKSRGNRGLLALISILVGIWLLGLLAVSLFRREPSPTPSVATSPEPNAAGSPATSPEATPPASENAFQDGLAKGMAAATLAQTAKSTDDWGLVVSQWQQAIDAFKAVPESSPDYATAQQKIAEYEGNLAIAQQRLASIPPIVETPSTAPAVIVGSGDVTCQEVPASEGAPQLEFSNVQLSNTRFVGCLTNHTDLPINAVSVVYQQTSPSAPDAATKKLGRLDVAVIQPGETQPFRSDFTLAADVKDATIQSIVWSSPTMSEPQKAEVQVSAVPE